MLTNCSHLAIHLYHFAYLTVDVTFVVQKIEQLKPLSGPYDMNVSHTQLFLYIIHVQVSYMKTNHTKHTYETRMLKYNTYTYNVLGGYHNYDEWICREFRIGKP